MRKTLQKISPSIHPRSWSRAAGIRVSDFPSGRVGEGEDLRPKNAMHARPLANGKREVDFDVLIGLRREQDRDRDPSTFVRSTPAPQTWALHKTLPWDWLLDGGID